MIIKKKRPQCKTIGQVVAENTGISREEFLLPKSNYRIDGLAKAATIIKTFGQNGQLITVIGDYDADGICGSAILKLVFDTYGWKYRIRLPRRFTEGYGLSEKIVNEIDEGLVITVDNGITAIDEVKALKDKGLTVIVTDHHLGLPDGILPCADIVIDPNAVANSADFNGYCGAGIAYKLALEIMGKDTPLRAKLKSLAALATIADVMPLVEENRAIVKEGLVEMLTKDGRTAGLAAILSECKQHKLMTAKNVSFKLAPMINAPGRMQDDGAEISLDALSYQGGMKEAFEKANLITLMNEERKTAKKIGVDILKECIETNNMQNDKVIVIYDERLQEGLLGLYAGQLAEEYGVPCFVLTNDKHNGGPLAHGSGRSDGDVNIKELLDENACLLEKYGGHASAAGVSLEISRVEEFRKAMNEKAKPVETSDSDVLEFDLKISADMINVALKNLDMYEPFGCGNPEIIFFIENFVVAQSRYLENGNTIELKNSQGKAIGFGMGHEYKALGEPRVINIVGTLSRSCFMDKVSNQIEILKIVPVQRNEMSDLAKAVAELGANRYKN